MSAVNRNWFWPAAILLLAILVATVSGQETRTKVVTMGGDDIEGPPYNLAELGAVIVQREGALEVLFVGPPEKRLKAYREVDLETGDRIVMVNGKKMTSVEDLEATLDVLAVGDEIKFGLKRGKDMRIVSFAKADPDDLPQAKMMMKHVSVGEDGEKKEMTFTTDGKGEEISVLTGGGMLVKAEAGTLVISHLLPDAEEILGEADVQAGDLVVKLQGNNVSDLEDLDQEWRLIETGDDVTLVLSRDGDRFQITFEKAEGRKPGVMMIKDVN
jgi:C-terminal processing protease CtpA/Prc